MNIIWQNKKKKRICNQRNHTEYDLYKYMFSSENVSKMFLRISVSPWSSCESRNKLESHQNSFSERASELIPWFLFEKYFYKSELKKK